MVKMQVSNKPGYQLLMLKISKMQNAKPAKNYGLAFRRERNGSNFTLVSVIRKILSYLVRFSGIFDKKTPKLRLKLLHSSQKCPKRASEWPLSVLKWLLKSFISGLFSSHFGSDNGHSETRFVNFWLEYSCLSKMADLFFELKKVNSILWAFDTRIWILRSIMSKNKY